MVNDERNDAAGFIGPEPTIGRWGRTATLLTLAFLVGNVCSSAEEPEVYGDSESFAFVLASVIPMDRERVIPDQTVLVAG